MSHEHEVLSASTVLGNQVRSAKGEDLGRVEELIIDPDTGRIIGALLSRTAGATDGDSGLSAIPWDALTLSPVDGSIVVDAQVVEHPLRRAKDWPETGKPVWSHNVTVYTSSIYKGGSKS